MFTDKAINLSSSVFSGATGMVLGLVALLAIVLAITAVYICNKYPNTEYRSVFEVAEESGMSSGAIQEASKVAPLEIELFNKIKSKLSFLNK